MDSLNNGPRCGGDAWLELQAFKTRQINRREKLNRHKDLINGITTSHNNNLHSASACSASSASAPSAAKDRSSCNLDQRANHLALDTHNSPLGDNQCCQSEQISEKKVILEGPNCINMKRGNHDNESHSQSHTFDIQTVECLLLLRLCDIALKLPIDSRSLLRSICKIKGLEHTTQSTVENLLEKFAHQELITIEEPTSSIMGRRSNRYKEHDDEICVYVISADHTKLVEFNRAFGSSDSIKALTLDEESSNEFNTSESQGSSASLNMASNYSGGAIEAAPTYRNPGQSKSSDKALPSDKAKKQSKKGDDVESLLSLSSTREKESKKIGEELLELLSKPTAKERNLLESFQSADGYQVQEFCPKGTKDECRRNIKDSTACDKLHFKKIIAKHTEESLGDCSFLNTCFHMDSCKYVHYEVDYDDNKAPKPNRKRKAQITAGAFVSRPDMHASSTRENDNQTGMASSNDAFRSKTKTQIAIYNSSERVLSTKPSAKYALSPEEQARIEIRNRKRFKTVLSPPQWIQCDLRYFDMSLLGKFSVVMADPPWDIHMNLPYGTMSDDEMRKLNVPALQDEGVIFLWVTGRAMELGRECLALWGYERADEILWVKTNQLQRIIRTGRTGHWLNHGKEHCLVGVKGNPTEMNRGLDCDIIVAEVRATSHKPDEIYGIIERLSPGTRKIELFGRAHNVQPNWITLGNQLDGVRLVEPNLIESFKKLNLPYETTDHTP